MVPISAALFGAGLVLFGLSHLLWLSLALMLVVGFGMMQGMAATNTIIQTLTPGEMRGPRDELLHDGLCGHGALWQFAGRWPGARHERLSGDGHYRELL